MPLSEFLKMLKHQSGERKAVSSSPDDLPSLQPENDLVELVWENGQVTTSRAKKSPTTPENFPLLMSRTREKCVGNASSSRFGMEEEMPPSVPSGDMDDEIGPWLNYSPTNSQPQEYGSQILPQVSCISTGNEPGFPLMDKGGSSNPNVVNLGPRNASKLDSSTSRFGLFGSWSGVSDIVSSNDSSMNLNHPTLKNSVPVQSSAALGSCRPLLNFTNFSRPVALARANLQLGIETKGKWEKAMIKECNNDPTAKTALNEVCSTSVRENDLSTQPNSTPVVQPHGDNLSDNDRAPSKLINVGRVSDGDKAVELGACSSVCSGSSGERASNDQPHGLKRKNRDNDESGCRSEDVEEEESAGMKKTANRGGMGPKRSRAAEVHNLSERRRRDRINEKMRALQELIPNCNKADKASMLDEAIEYLKTLQLQVQIMSMGAGLCMPQMMFPGGIHPMHAQMPHYPQMSLGIGMGMGFGMGFPPEINGRSPGCPIYPMPTMPRPHFSSPSISGPINFPGMAASNIQAFGHGIPMSVPPTPAFPLPQQQPSANLGFNASKMGMHGEVPSKSAMLHPEDPVKIKNLQLTQNADPSRLPNQTTTQVQTTNEDPDLPSLVQESDQPPNASDDPTLNMTNSTNNNPGSSKAGM